MHYSYVSMAKDMLKRYFCLQDNHFMMKVSERAACPTCNGSGKVVTGYGVVCTELVEKVEKCPECDGKGFSKKNIGR